MRYCCLFENAKSYLLSFICLVWLFLTKLHIKAGKEQLESNSTPVPLTSLYPKIMSFTHQKIFENTIYKFLNIRLKYGKIRWIKRVPRHIRRRCQKFGIESATITIFLDILEINESLGKKYTHTLNCYYNKVFRNAYKMLQKIFARVSIVKKFRKMI